MLPASIRQTTNRILHPGAPQQMRSFSLRRRARGVKKYNGILGGRPNPANKQRREAFAEAQEKLKESLSGQIKYSLVGERPGRESYLGESKGLEHNIGIDEFVRIRDYDVSPAYYGEPLESEEEDVRDDPNAFNPEVDALNFDKLALSGVQQGKLHPQKDWDKKIKKPLWGHESQYYEQELEEHLMLDERLFEKPWISREVKEKLFEVYMEDPTYWTYSRLANRFNILETRVEAIIRLKDFELKQDLTQDDRVAADAIEILMEQYLGVTDHESPILVESRREPIDFSYVNDDFDFQRASRNLWGEHPLKNVSDAPNQIAKPKKKRAPWERIPLLERLEVPSTPMETNKDRWVRNKAKIEALRSPEVKDKDGFVPSKGTLLVDIDRCVRDQNRTIYVIGNDGKIRQPTEKELYKFYRWYRPNEGRSFARRDGTDVQKTQPKYLRPDRFLEPRQLTPEMEKYIDRVVQTTNTGKILWDIPKDPSQYEIVQTYMQKRYAALAAASSADAEAKADQ